MISYCFYLSADIKQEGFDHPPSEVTGHQLHAQLLMQMGQATQAIPLWHYCIDSAPSNGTWWLQLGHCYSAVEVWCTLCSWRADLVQPRTLHTNMMMIGAYGAASAHLRMV